MASSFFPLPAVFSSANPACRDGPWQARLVQIAQRRSLAYQLQDLQCAKCRTVQRHHSSTRCEKCAAAFSLRIRVDAVETSLATFANIADHLDFPWLAETVAFLRGQGFSQAPEIF